MKGVWLQVVTLKTKLLSGASSLVPMTGTLLYKRVDHFAPAKVPAATGMWINQVNLMDLHLMGQLQLASHLCRFGSRLTSHPTAIL